MFFEQRASAASTKKASGKLLGAIGVYVDDFLFVESEDPAWKKIMTQIKGLYTWGKHDYKEFVLCGVGYKQLTDFSIVLDQREYVQEKLKPNTLTIGGDLKNAKDTDLVKDPGWVRKFRGANGALQWLVTNTRPDLAAEVSISAGTAGVGITKGAIVNVQKIMRKAMSRVDVEIKFQPIPMKDLRFVTFHDAGWASRPDGSSQGGDMVFATHQKLLLGNEAAISLVDWKSWKLKRVC